MLGLPGRVWDWQLHMAIGLAHSVVSLLFIFVTASWGSVLLAASRGNWLSSLCIVYFVTASWGSVGLAAAPHGNRFSSVNIVYFVTASWRRSIGLAAALTRIKI
jgi:hypothetical protein